MFEDTLAGRFRAAVFGVFIGACGLLSAAFAAIGPIRWVIGPPDSVDWRAGLMVVLFTPMAAILLGAASKMLRFAATGRRDRLVHPLVFRFLASVVGGLVVTCVVMGLLQWDLDGLATAIEGVALLLLMLQFFAARHRLADLDRASSGPKAPS